MLYLQSSYNQFYYDMCNNTVAVFAIRHPVKRIILEIARCSIIFGISQ